MVGKRPFRVTWAVLVVLFSAANSAWACPMCKLALETDDPQPRAYMISILFMMGTIFTLFGVTGAVVWWMSKRERHSLEEAGYGHLFENAVTQMSQGVTTPDAV
jgi:hypothetical protein